jgi:hypothetical protein
MSTDSGFFNVHLQSLERFANELEGQLDAMRKPSDRLGELAGQELPLGRFAEAYALGLRQLTAAQQMYGLLQAVREAVGFAGEVTRTITASYRQFDQQAAGGYAAPGTTGTGPAVTPASVGVSVPPAASDQPVTYADPAQAPTGPVGG